MSVERGAGWNRDYVSRLPTPSRSPRIVCHPSGRLHCCAVRTRSLWESLRISRRLLDGSHVDREEVDIVSDTAFRVAPVRAPLAIQVDGEVRTGIEGFGVAVRPGAVRVVTASED